MKNASQKEWISQSWQDDLHLEWRIEEIKLFPLLSISIAIAYPQVSSLNTETCPRTVEETGTIPRQVQQ